MKFEELKIDEKYIKIISHRIFDNKLQNKYIKKDGEKIRSQIETYFYLKNRKY